MTLYIACADVNDEKKGRNTVSERPALVATLLIVDNDDELSLRI